LDQREFFDSVAEKWDSICRHDPDKIKTILDFADIAAGGSVLDVGTGTGVMLPYILERVGNGGNITAVDLSGKMLQIARSKYGAGNIRYVCGDVLNVGLPQSYFDYILCYSVFPHFAEKQAAISKLGALLKTRGKIVICHSQSRAAINMLHKNTSGPVSEDDLPEMAVIRTYFSNAGMETVAEIDNAEMFVIIAQK
jgi:ubiquinone/menaquinone biosynthesis C-methylase UbiE